MMGNQFKKRRNKNNKKTKEDRNRAIMNKVKYGKIHSKRQYNLTNNNRYKMKINNLINKRKMGLIKITKYNKITK